MTKLEGLTIVMQNSVMDGVSPGMNEGCDYTTDVEDGAKSADRIRLSQA